MKNKIILPVLICLIVLSLILASCGTKTTPITTVTTTIKPTTALTIKPTTTITSAPATTASEEPQHGGTLTFRVAQGPINFDSFFIASQAGDRYRLWLETLCGFDASLKPESWDVFKIPGTPLSNRAGHLAESWEIPDYATVIFHIRKGINWQNIAPVNGREFTAFDVEYHFNRLFGIGSGFTEAGPAAKADATMRLLKSVTATDKYTVVFKWKQPSLDMIEALVEPAGTGPIVAREVVDKFGNAQNWRSAVGTGPWILADYVSDSSLSTIKNPQYWKYDEHHPENRLPYADALKILIIPDLATALAAVRTGKIDLIEDIDWVQARSLTQTNPYLLQITRPKEGPCLHLRCDQKPYTDIRVRTALQMAIDLNDIAKNYYGGLIDSTPVGLVHPLNKFYYVPFDQWPKDLQAGFTYNLEGAKKLLADAGYASGFKTNLVVPSSQDLDLMQIIKAFFAKVGVDMEIRVLDPASFSAFVNAKKHDQITARVPGGTGYTYIGSRIMSQRYSAGGSNLTMNNDKYYDSLYDKFNLSLNPEERRQIVIDSTMYGNAQHWTVNILPVQTFSLYQPWFKGFAGEIIVDRWYSYYWIDQSLKRSMKD